MAYAYGILYMGFVNSCIFVLVVWAENIISGMLSPTLWNKSMPKSQQFATWVFFGPSIHYVVIAPSFLFLYLLRGTKNEQKFVPGRD